MKEIKIVKYEAEDGSVFESKTDCEAYELALSKSGFDMYLYDGTKTEYLNEAQFVITYGALGVKKFKQFSIDDENSCENVDDQVRENDMCLFWYHDESDARYACFEPICVGSEHVMKLVSVLQDELERRV